MSFKSPFNFVSFDSYYCIWHMHFLTELSLIEFPFTADFINSSHDLGALDFGIEHFPCLTLASPLFYP